ncbi:pyruvate kinase alpha/beta domain-containing protein [Desulfotomaculum sp. 1211_IL3151]|uniref:pyruvate kinase alpha/beta domain-containing protein n=1 Tax=Desulfotomaculum sp. 1211_IL3151 TaxID=3084055 RepID=UPI002FDB8925
MVYWEKEGKENTWETIKAAIKFAEDKGISFIVVASSSGATAEKFIGCDKKVVCVTYQAGFREPGQASMEKEVKERLQQANIEVLSTTHLMAGLDRALRFKFQGVYPSEMMAATLRMFGQGVKVCVEVAGMALDAGLIPYGEEIVVVAGSGKGADTALSLVPAHSQHFFETKIKEIICKPREFEHH